MPVVPIYPSCSYPPYLPPAAVVPGPYPRYPLANHYLSYTTLYKRIDLDKEDSHELFKLCSKNVNERVEDGKRGKG
jgi:hypothetical protein